MNLGKEEQKLAAELRNAVFDDHFAQIKARSNQFANSPFVTTDRG
jgi:hypothetical protein